MKEKLKQSLLNYAKNHSFYEQEFTFNKQYTTLKTIYKYLSQPVPKDKLIKFFKTISCYELGKAFLKAYHKDLRSCYIIYNKFHDRLFDDIIYPDFPVTLQLDKEPITKIKRNEFKDLFISEYEKIMKEPYHYFPNKIACYNFIKKEISPHLERFSRNDIILFIQLYLQAVKRKIWSSAPSIQGFWRTMGTEYYQNALITKVVKGNLDVKYKRLYLICRFYHNNKFASQIVDNFVNLGKVDFKEFYVKFKTSYNELFLGKGGVFFKDCFIPEWMIGDD